MLLQTIHGSHLYGFAHANSDVDIFRVINNKPGRKRARYAKQSITDEDALTCDLSTFMQYSGMGVPQFLEAMYSRVATIDELGLAFRLNFRPDIASATEKYSSTIKALYSKGEEQGLPKFIRHGYRLAYNLYELQHGIAFNPTIDQDALNEHFNIDISMLGA